MIKTCAMCGAEFEANFHLRKYCSQECYERANRITTAKKYVPVRRMASQYHFEPIVKGFCIACTKKFNATFAGGKFCSDACRIKYFNA